MGQVSDAREKLVRSALDLMYSRSYASVGVQELCAHAGVQKGSFYHFFPSKRDLTLAALERQQELGRCTILEPAFCPDRPPLRRIEAWFDLLHEHAVAMKRKTGCVPGCIVGNLAVELSTQDEVIRHKVADLLRDLTRLIERTVAEAITRRDLPPQNPGVLAEALVAYMEGVTLMAKTHNEPGLIKRLGRKFLRQLMGGVTGREHGSRAAR